MGSKTIAKWCLYTGVASLAVFYCTFFGILLWFERPPPFKLAVLLVYGVAALFTWAMIKRERP